MKEKIKKKIDKGEKDFPKRVKRLNELSRKNPEPLIRWLIDAEQISENEEDESKEKKEDHFKVVDLIKKKEYLIKNIPKLIKQFNYRKGPDLYFYKKVIAEGKKESIRALLNRKDYIELLYSTLISWDMNARGAKMKYFDEFKANILKNKDYLEELSRYKLNKLNRKDLLKVKEILGKLYDTLEVMRTKGRLVSNSKVMHYFLPDLVMPMDRYNTLNFFFGNTAESKDKFLDIIECTYYITKEINLNKFLDNEWNQSIPKIIDNAIISECSPRYRLK